MKNAILKVTGLAAMATLMMYNVQVSDPVVETNTSLTALAQSNGRALAESQSGKFCCIKKENNTCSQAPDC